MTVLNSLMSQEDLATAKAAAREAVAGAAVPAAAGPIWRLFHFPTAAETVNFANIPPVQVAGQFGMTSDPAGGFDGYYFY